MVSIVTGCLLGVSLTAPSLQSTPRRPDRLGLGIGGCSGRVAGQVALAASVNCRGLRPALGRPMSPAITSARRKRGAGGLSGTRHNPDLFEIEHENRACRRPLDLAKWHSRRVSFGRSTARCAAFDARRATLTWHSPQPKCSRHTHGTRLESVSTNGIALQPATADGGLPLFGQITCAVSANWPHRAALSSCRGAHARRRANRA